MSAQTTHALRGQTLAFHADPFEHAPEDSVTYHRDGMVVIADGNIIDVGPADALELRFPDIAVEHYPGQLIMAGFVDCHIHYPQTEIIASYGAQLLEWLETYTFPAEAKFHDAAYARSVADLFLDELVGNGITTASVYCTSHPQSVDAFFEASVARGLRMAAGKVMMDRNAPGSVLDTVTRGYDESRALIARWHGRDRQSYVITPRFAITSSAAQLEAAGALWRAHPDTLMQTHLSENHAEIAWVKQLFPDAPDYFGVYETYGLTGPGANFGHAIHLEPREIAAICETGSGLSHCPTSNLFIGSGLFDMNAMRRGASPVPVGIASDVGGGSSFSMFSTMRAAYEIAQLRGVSLHPAQLFYLATLGSAGVMRLDTKIGNLAPGFEADIIVIDVNSTPVITQRMRQAKDLKDMLFVQMILADDRAIRAVYSAGRKVSTKGM